MRKPRRSPPTRETRAPARPRHVLTVAAAAGDLLDRAAREIDWSDAGTCGIEGSADVLADRPRTLLSARAVGAGSAGDPRRRIDPRRWGDGREDAAIGLSRRVCRVRGGVGPCVVRSGGPLGVDPYGLTSTCRGGRREDGKDENGERPEGRSETGHKSLVGGRKRRGKRGESLASTRAWHEVARSIKKSSDRQSLRSRWLGGAGPRCHVLSDLSPGEHTCARPGPFTRSLQTFVR